MSELSESSELPKELCTNCGLCYNCHSINNFRLRNPDEEYEHDLQVEEESATLREKKNQESDIISNIQANVIEILETCADLLEYEDGNKLEQYQIKKEHWALVSQSLDELQKFLFEVINSSSFERRETLRNNYTKFITQQVFAVFKYTEEDAIYTKEYAIYSKQRFICYDNVSQDNEDSEDEESVYSEDEDPVYEE